MTTTSTTRRRGAGALAALAAGVLVLSGCGTSTPSAKRVARDAVASLDEDQVTDEERACMNDKIDAYSEEDLEAMASDGENAVDFTVTDDGRIEGGTEALADFFADLQTCIA